MLVLSSIALMVEASGYGDHMVSVTSRTGRWLRKPSAPRAGPSCGNSSSRPDAHTAGGIIGIALGIGVARCEAAARVQHDDPVVPRDRHAASILVACLESPGRARAKLDQ